MNVLTFIEACLGAGGGVRAALSGTQGQHGESNSSESSHSEVLGPKEPV